MKSRRLGLLIGVLVVLSSFCTIITTVPQNAGAITHHVGGSGPGNHTSILSAVLIADPGDTIYVHSGWYGEQFDVTKPLTIVGEDRDTTVITGDGWSPTIIITSDWVNISGFTIAKRVTGPGSTAFELTGTDHCNISNNVILENEFGFNLFFANHTVIIDNVMKDGEYGVYSLHSNNLTIADNNISSNDIGMMLFDSGNSTIQNNDLWFNADYGIYFAHNHGNVIEGNRISSSADDGIHLYRSDRNAANDNWVSGSGEAGMTLYLSNFNDVSSNNVSNNWWGISLWGSDNNTLSNNTASDCSAGILLEKSSNDTLADNTMVGGGIYFSLEDDKLRYWNTHYIETTNTVNDKPVVYRKNQWRGSVPRNAGQVILANCTDMTISGLHITNVFMALAAGYSDYNTFTYNNISDNNVGMFLTYSDRNTVRNNTLSFNHDFGILLTYSKKNNIYHNSFIENGNQSSEAEGNNSWDWGYPAGGNYWSDYTGVDVMRGPGQNLTGSDNIGDVSRNIPFGPNVDRYPLKIPFTFLPSEPLVVTALVYAGQHGEVVLYWHEPQYDGGHTITNYRIYRGDASGEEVFLVEVGDVHTYNDTGLKNGHTYYYFVTAVNEVGESVESREVYATPEGDTQPPQISWFRVGILVSAIGAIVVVIVAVFIVIKEWRRKREGEPSEPIPEEPIEPSLEEEVETTSEESSYLFPIHQILQLLQQILSSDRAVHFSQ